MISTGTEQRSGEQNSSAPEHPNNVQRSAEHRLAEQNTEHRTIQFRTPNIEQGLNPLIY